MSSLYVKKLHINITTKIRYQHHKQVVRVSTSVEEIVSVRVVVSVRVIASVKVSVRAITSVSTGDMHPMEVCPMTSCGCERAGRRRRCC